MSDFLYGFFWIYISSISIPLLYILFALCPSHPYSRHPLTLIHSFLKKWRQDHRSLQGSAQSLNFPSPPWTLVMIKHDLQTSGVNFTPLDSSSLPVHMSNFSWVPWWASGKLEMTLHTWAHPSNSSNCERKTDKWKIPWHVVNTVILHSSYLLDKGHNPEYV